MRDKVFAFLKTIPKGKVATYGQIAAHLGNRNLARAVGNILHSNPDPGNFPCHRVVNSRGQVAAHFAFGGAQAQRKLLEQEGIVFESDGTVDLVKYGIKENCPEGGSAMKRPASNYDLQVDIGKRIFLEYDQELLIRKFRLKADTQYIYLTYLSTPCRISRKDGGIEEYVEGVWKECRSFSTVMTVYDLLCYHRGESLPPLAGQWCAVGNFVVTGVTNTDTFTKKYAAKFDGRLEELKAAAQSMGGVLLPRMAGADVTCRFGVTPFFPVLLQFWEGDDEFPPKLMLLWDRNTDSFLHFETTFYLQGDLLERLWNKQQKL